ncbi:MAG: DegQ family serine endoprotease [Deltaproteobacteria bacterium]|jgi:serine protease Do|nr:DegQ family serine endoprotease [Deltaproteobacteria bacterium]
MIAKLKENLNNKRYGVKGLIAVGLPFLVAGLLMASGLNWTKPSVAEDLMSGPHVSTTSPPAMPSSFAELADKLSPTVVNVKVTKIEKADFHGPQFPEGNFGEFFERFFKEMPRMPENHRTQGAGSGVIISEDGYILTNNHVVEGAKEVTVTLADKKEYGAQVVGRDPKTDLAVLKIEAKKPLPAAAMGDSEHLRVGDWVVAIGNPFGLSHTVTSGIVSAKGRVIGAGPYDDFIQTDASINPGNSGGPLFNMSGEVVGINTAIIPYGQGIGFAIPVNTAKPLIPQLVTKGEVTRGYLGVSIQTITPDLAKALKVKDHEGALVADVISGSPAEKGGIERGDIIIAYDGKAVKDSHDLPPMVAATPVDEEVTVTVLRDGKEHKLPMKVGKLPSEEAKIEKSVQPAKGKWGLQLHDLNPQIAHQLGLKDEQGVVVVGVEPGSPADEAGIQQGDVIVEMDRHSVHSVNDIKENIDKSKDKDHVLLLVQRDNGTFYIPLEQQG